MTYSVLSPTRSVTPVVTVGGITLQNLVSASVSFSLDSPVPTADVTVAGKLPDWIQRNMSATIDLAGRLFTGTVKRRQRSPGQSTIQCVGLTQKLWQPFKVDGWVFTNVSAQAAVEQILAEVGITGYSIDMVAWTIGVAQDAVIDLKTPGEAIDLIIDVDGHRMFELPSGGLVIRPLLGVPAPSVFRTYTTLGTAPWVNDISDDEDPDQVKKQVYVTGAALGSLDAEGNAGQTQIESPAVFTDSNELVSGAPELYSMDYSNHLIEDVVKATSVALRLLDKYHRIIERISLTVPLDPDIRLAMTLGIEDAAVTGRSVRWFVEGYTHSFANGQCETRLDLIGGDQSGTSGKVKPIADFVYKMDREVIGTSMQVLVSLHSISVDLDGTLANFHWSDNYTPAHDESGATLEDVAWVYDPTVQTTVDITLEVTDNDGLTASITKTLYLGPGAMPDEFVPQIAAACFAGAGAGMFTPDGGWTWNDKAAPSGNFVSVSAADYTAPDDQGVILLGTTNGRIYRSLDQLQTAPTLIYTIPGGSQVNHIWWDSNVPGRVWACTQAGALYWSTDGQGGTWALFYDFGATWGPLNRIATPPGIPAVWLYGGRGDVPNTWIVYNIDQAHPGFWYQPDMSGAVPSAQADTVVEAASNGPDELAIIFKGTREPAIMYAADIFASPVVWQDAVGLAAGLNQGRFIAPQGAPTGEEHSTLGTFLVGFDDKEMWVTADGVNYSRTVTQLPSPGAPSLSTIAGSLPNATYGYRVSALNEYGETIPGAEQTIAIVAGPQGVHVTWAAVLNATGYRIYGRTPASELFMAEVAAVTQWDDNGSVVPGGAMPTVNSTSWVLPGTAANEPWHAMNVRGHPTLFFGASIEGLWKTVDGGVHVNFIRPAAGISTWPASAVGKMISFVAQATEPTQEPDEVWVITQLAGINKLVKLEGTAWSVVKADLGPRAMRLHWIGTDLFYVNDAGLQRSQDNGLNFTNVLVDAVDVVKGSDGIFWAITRSATQAEESKVWSSSTGGAGSWTLKYTGVWGQSAGQYVWFNSIDTDPNNAQRIVVVGSRDAGTLGAGFVYSLNGGAAWTVGPNPNNFGSSWKDMNVVWGQSARVVITRRNILTISVSDSPYSALVDKYTSPDPGGSSPNSLIRAGMWLWATRTGALSYHCLVRSNNNGESWEEVWVAGQRPHYGAAHNPDGARLFVVVSRVVGATTDVDRLMPSTDPMPAVENSRTPLQYNWGTVLGDTTQVEQGVAVKPNA